MKSLPWFLIAIGAAVAAYVFINQPGMKYAAGPDDVEDAAGKTTFWGSKQRLSGKAQGLVGEVKKSIGRVTGNDDLADEGFADQVIGKVKDVAGGVAQAAGTTLHEINR